MDFAIPTDHKVKMKESEKLDRYLDLDRELQKLWNMMVRVEAIICGQLRTVLKSLEKRVAELEIRRCETKQTTEFSSLCSTSLQSWEI